MSHLSIVDVAQDHAVGHTDQVALYVWRGVTTLTGARAFGQAVKNVVRSGNDTGLILGIVEANAPPPTAEVRKALAEGLSAGAKGIRASAVAFEGEGFRASMVRAVATGLAMLSRPPYPHESFANAPAAARWLEQHRDSSGKVICSARELEDLLHELRSTRPQK